MFFVRVPPRAESKLRQASVKGAKGELSLAQLKNPTELMVSSRNPNKIYPFGMFSSTY